MSHAMMVLRGPDCPRRAVPASGRRSPSKTERRESALKIWKIGSGALSAALSLFVVCQAFWGGALNLLAGEAPSGVAGLVVAATLLAGGIISIVTSRGSLGADIALITLHGLGALVGFTMSGRYADLMLWALWSFLCAVLALVDFVVAYNQDDNIYEDFSTHVPQSGPPTLRAVVMEPNQKKREAAIDSLPEHEAKSYLKQLVTAFINREPIKPTGIDDDPPAGHTVLTVIISLVVVAVAGAIIFFTVQSLLPDGDGPGTVPSPSAQFSEEPSAPPTPQPSEPLPSAGPSGNLGNYYVEIKSAVLTSDYGGSPAILITYSWTNNSQETTNALSAFIERAFQDGVQLDSATILSTNPQYSSGTALRDVRPGATTDVQRAYLISDSGSPVEFEVFEFLGDSEAGVSITFDPASLPAVE